MHTESCETKTSRKLHLGCGMNIVDGWINLDGSWNARLAKHPNLKRLLKFFRIFPASLANIPWNTEILIHDLRKPLPFHDNYFSAIYASHLLEHLYLEQAKHLLKECFRVLKPCGVLRMVVPDLSAIILEYMGEAIYQDSDKEMSRADRLNKRLLLRHTAPPTGNFIYRIYNALKDFHSHKWMYDADSLTGYFKSAGFVNVKEMTLHQSLIEDIKKIEEKGRVLNGCGICVEGVKPEMSI